MEPPPFHRRRDGVPGRVAAATNSPPAAGRGHQLGALVAIVAFSNGESGPKVYERVIVAVTGHDQPALLWL